MVQVRVANVTRVALSPVGGATSCPKEPIRLSFLDTFWIPLPPVQRLFLYSTVDRPLAAVAQDLRASLARVLPRFCSLAGTLTHVPDSGDVVISFCGDGRNGVDVLEAEADEGAEYFRRLAEDEDHDIEAFSSLVPPLDIRGLPAPVFAVQVTGFGGGGVAVGLSLLHVVADGKALWLFVEAWAAECRRAVLGGCGGAVVAPVLDRSVIKCPDDEDLARSYTRTAAPDLPKLHTGSWFPDRQHLQRRTFVIGASSIATLRNRATSDGGARPSTFVTLAAHTWLTFLRAKSVPLDDQTSTLSFLVDCRRHLDPPPVGDEYFGNCVHPCHVQAKTKELLGGNGGGFAAACVVAREAINDCLREPLGGRHCWQETWRSLPRERRVNVAASPRFSVYETNFGWGRPRRVELVSMNKDGEVAMVAARDEEGAIQETVALSPLYMDSFTSLFLGSLQEPIDVDKELVQV